MFFEFLKDLFLLFEFLKDLFLKLYYETIYHIMKPQYIWYFPFYRGKV